MTTIIGILLILGGILTLSYKGITYTKQEKVAEVNLPAVGQLKVVEEKKEHIPFPPVLGGLALVAGIILVFVGRKNNK
jgi:hypothetical protein